jgi:hypothetical protein
MHSPARARSTSGSGWEVTRPRLRSGVSTYSTADVSTSGPPWAPRLLYTSLPPGRYVLASIAETS